MFTVHFEKTEPNILTTGFNEKFIGNPIADCYIQQLLNVNETSMLNIRSRDVKVTLAVIFAGICVRKSWQYRYARGDPKFKQYKRRQIYFFFQVTVEYDYVTSLHGTVWRFGENSN